VIDFTYELELTVCITPSNYCSVTDLIRVQLTTGGFFAMLKSETFE